MRHTVRGFTLLELIVVIAIIGVLSVVILPTFKDALARAKDTSIKQYARTLDKKYDIVNKYDFEEGSGLVSKDNNIYTQNNLTLPGSGVTWDTNTYSSSSAFSLLFNGTNHPISQNNLPNIDASSFSFSIWIRRTGGFGTEASILSKGTSGLRQNLVFWLTTPDLISFAMWSDDYVSTTKITDTNWHHLAVSFDGATYVSKIYLDSVYIGGKTHGGSFVGTNSYPLRVGGYQAAPSFTGNIDDLRFYNSTLSVGEVQKLYAEGVSSGKFADR